MVHQTGETISNQEDGASIDLNGIGRALWRNRRMITLATLGCLLASTAFVTLAKARYTAEAKVLIENQESFLTRPDKGTPDAGPGPDPEAVLSQVQLIQSRDLARNAIRELGLVGKPEFDPQAGGGFLSRAFELLGLSRNLTERSPEDRVFETYFADLTVFPVPKSRVVSIEFVSNDPALAARAANTIAEIYINIQSKAKRDSARQNATSLESLISGLKLKLAESEARAERFRLKSGLLVGANNLTITAQQLSDINTQLTAARTQQADAQAKSRLIRDMLRQGRLGEVPDIASNDLVRRISEQRVTLRGQLALETRTLLPGHPRIKELTAQIVDIDNQLRSAADKSSRTLENEARIAASRVENLTATLEGQKKVAGVANSDDVTQREYDSESKLLKEQLDTSSARYQEAVARQNAITTPADARVISRAVEPIQATFPKKIPIILLSTLAGFVFATGGVVAGQMLSGQAGQPAFPLPVPVAPQMDAEPVMQRPRRRSVLAGLPGDDALIRDNRDGLAENLAEDVSELMATSADSGGFFEVEHLASRILAGQPSGHATVTLIAAAQDGDALAPNAIALARALARQQRTILVNLDIYSRQIDQLATNNSGEGLVDLLGGRASFAEVIHRDSLTRLHFLGHGKGVFDIADGLDEILDALCETYDQVVLALPSVSESALARTLAPHADYAVLTTPGATAAMVDVAVKDLRDGGSMEVLVLDTSGNLGHQRPAVPA